MSKWAGTYLSDENHMSLCKEYMPTRIGLMQRLNPYQVNRLKGVPLPSVLPTAQRAYDLTRYAEGVAQRGGLPFDEVMARLKQTSENMNFPSVSQPNQRVVLGGGKRDQPSLLAVKVKPRESDFAQLNRAEIFPNTGGVIAKTGSTPPPMEQTGATGATEKPKEQKDPDSIMATFKDEV